MTWEWWCAAAQPASPQRPDRHFTIGSVAGRPAAAHDVELTMWVPYRLYFLTLRYNRLTHVCTGQ